MLQREFLLFLYLDTLMRFFDVLNNNFLCCKCVFLMLQWSSDKIFLSNVQVLATLKKGKSSKTRELRNRDSTRARWEWSQRPTGSACTGASAATYARVMCFSFLYTYIIKLCR